MDVVSAVIKTAAINRFRLNIDVGVPVGMINKAYAQKSSFYPYPFALFQHSTLYLLFSKFYGLFFHFLLLLKYNTYIIIVYTHVCIIYTCVYTLCVYQYIY